MAALARPARSIPFSLPGLLRPSWSLLCEPSTSTDAPLASSSASTVTPSQTYPKQSTLSAVASSAILIMAASAGTAPWYTFLPGLSSLLELLPPILLAVPKHKVTHSRKSMRSANKGLKNKTNISNCEACGMPKLAHNLCSNCYSQISRRWKKEARGEVTSVSGGSATSG